LPTLSTLKFGVVTFKNTDVITFVRPIIGFNDLARYFVISRQESEPFKWLQCVDDPSICFVILDPKLVYADYVVDIGLHDVRQLGGSDKVSDYLIYGIVSVPKGHPEQMSINLQGPIIINVKNLKAIQMVLNNPGYEIRYSLFKSKQTA
jgi:flagellar assembly factor FliW